MEPAARTDLATSESTWLARGAPGGAHAPPGCGMDVDLACENVRRNASNDGCDVRGRKECVADDANGSRERWIGAAMASLVGCEVERVAGLGRWSAWFASVAMAAAVARALHVLLLETGRLWKSRTDRCDRISTLRCDGETTRN